MSTLALFEEKQVRRAWNQTDEKWYFSIDDVVEVLTGSINVKDHIKKLRKRDSTLNTYQGTNCPLVAMPGADGKIRPIRAANAESMLRLIQSIPSPKAEPFKLWLAKVGYERLEEIEDPELATCLHHVHPESGIKTVAECNALPQDRQVPHWPLRRPGPPPLPSAPPSPLPGNQQLILAMVANPQPVSRIVPHLGNGSEIVIHSHAPKPSHLFEVQRRMIRVLMPQTISLVSLPLNRHRQSLIQLPKSRSGGGFHSADAPPHWKDDHPIRLQENPMLQTPHHDPSAHPNANCAVHQTTSPTSENLPTAKERWPSRSRPLCSYLEYTFFIFIFSTIFNKPAKKATVLNPCPIISPP
ncbi:BRO-N domain-containing protein [Phragmitibacter flavus]|uniref:BRO-N domain-containing protein n=1 Tax=Phragmitibacter flavus TaxID=2576071 RepID=UPI0019813F05|nr:Bro-N domain-containing protein [Phragmitibacter flavus]